MIRFKTFWILLTVTFVASTQAQNKESVPVSDINQPRNIDLTITFDEFTHIDTLHLLYLEDVISAKAYTPPTLKSWEAKDKSFRFKIKSVEHPMYISLFKDATGDANRPVYLVDVYLAEPGDSVFIHIDFSTRGLHNKISRETFYELNPRITFEGRGSAKYRCRRALDLLLWPLFEKKVMPAKNYDFRIYADSLLACGNEVLESYKKHMSVEAFHILRIDFVSIVELKKIEWIGHEWRRKQNNHIYSSQDVLACIEGVQKSLKRFPEFAKQRSWRYPQFVNESLALAFLKGDVRRTADEKASYLYGQIKNYFVGDLRDKLLTYLLINLMDGRQEINRTLYDDAIKTINHEHYKMTLASFAESKLSGTNAYDFSLPDAKGNIIRLRDFHGKVVVIDFWFTGCSSCSIFYTSTFSKVKQIFRNDPKVAFISISIDADKQKWIEATFSGKYTSKDACNLYTGGEGEKHIVIQKYNVSYYPRLIIVDKYGKIFCNNSQELKKGGVEKIVETINGALNEGAIDIKQTTR